MKTPYVLLMLQAVFAAVLMWSSLCRLVKTDKRTHREVRWAIWFEGVAGGFVFGAPLMPLLMPQQAHWRAWTTPTWVWLTLLLAVTLMQVVTAKFWATGTVPGVFQRHGLGRSGAAFAAAAFMTASLWAVQPVLAEAQEHPEAQPFQKIAQGEHATCLAESGCVAMTQAAFVNVMRQAMEQGAENCRRTL